MNLFDTYSKIDKNILEGYVKEKQEENLYLDFKTINNSDFSNKDDKRNLSRSISGFANSSGGIIIWGIIAKKNDNNIDCANSFQLIENLNLSKSKINELTGRAVNPLVENILHKVVKFEHDKGVLISLVPESDSGPHMAKLGHDRYFKRSGDSFYRMEHYDIEDMFGRRKKPKLILRGYPIKYRRRENKVLILLSIENIGRNIAKYPFLSIALPSVCGTDLYGIDGNGNTGLPIITRRNTYWGNLHFGGQSGYVIHPGVILDAVMINCPQDIKDKILIKYQVGAEGINLYEDTLEIPIEEIKKVIYN
ncbi:MAG TPA: putative DNA binding domain-containing protein [Candidatus Marinimicrobia bacterium]|mgnify:FL=1|nr:putative DNA binding domain-containing protein [Candidatus Neomarinimicrobiota bacterium]